MRKVPFRNASRAFSFVLFAFYNKGKNVRHTSIHLHANLPFEEGGRCHVAFSLPFCKHLRA
jgi:hypothetical protein